MGKAPSFRQLDKRVVKAFFYKHDPELAKQARDDFQDIFRYIADQAINDSRPFKLKEELLCFRLLSFYPFLKPDGENVEFPLEIDGTVRKVNYQFKRIELTDDKLVSPLVAYGLWAQDASPILLFKGTTFPADEGFARSLLADFTPNNSVGGSILKKPSEQLVNWVSDKKGIIVSGISLGGSLAQHFGVDFAEKTSKIYAFSAPRLLESEMKDDAPPCIRVNTKGDIVTKVGDTSLPKTTTYEIETDEKYNLFWRHILAPESHENKEISEKRSEGLSFLAKLHRITSPVIYGLLSFAITIFLYLATLFKASARLLKL